MTRAEHLAWCKQRALNYLGQGDLHSAFLSMSSDLNKHPETQSLAKPELLALGLFEVMHGNAAGLQDFIEGFN